MYPNLYTYMHTFSFSFRISRSGENDGSSVGLQFTELNPLDMILVSQGRRDILELMFQVN